MSASNYNYVCFQCRTSVRHTKTAKGAPKCLTCGDECFCLGYKVEVPRHADVKSWQKLGESCLLRGQFWNGKIAVEKVRRQHFLEQEIRRLHEMPHNPDRNRQIRKLEEELVQLSAREGDPDSQA